MWHTISFGNHEGKTIPQIAFGDPDYLFWAVEKKIFKIPAQHAQAESVGKNARRIKLPSDKYPNSTVEYVIHPGVGKLASVRVVPIDLPLHDGASPTFRKPYFDLAAARALANYDKMGGKTIIGAVKKYVLGNEKIRMTRDRCNAFFSDTSNFA